MSSFHLPDYQNASIVNLMSSIRAALGPGAGDYPPLGALLPEELAAARNVLLLVVDGLGYEYLLGRGDTQMGQHLRARLTSVFPSTTASAITTFLTGAAPQQHALTGWFMYFRELGTVSAVLPFRARSGGPAFGKWGVDPVAFFGHRPLFDDLTVSSHVLSPAYILNSDYSRSHCGRASRRGYRDMADFLAALQAILTRGRHRAYVYAYWSEFDKLAHHHGIGSRQVAAHFASLDAAFSALCDGLAGSDTLVVVTADHGLVDTDERSRLWLEDYPGLAETLVLPLCGEPRVAYCYVRSGRRAQFEDYARGALAEQAHVFVSDDLVERGFFGQGPVHPRLRERIGDFTLVMKGNWVMRDRLPVERAQTHVGVHGGVSSQEMYVPLIVRRV